LHVISCPVAITIEKNSAYRENKNDAIPCRFNMSHNVACRSNDFPDLRIKVGEDIEFLYKFQIDFLL